LRYFVIKQKRKRNKFSLKKFRKIRIFWWFQCHECIKGCLEFPGNDDKERQSYDGDFKDKKAHGKGLMRWRNGDKYEGEFKEGLRHGKGTYISKETGAKYDGEYQNDLKHGQGKYTYGNGDIYKGQWQNGIRHGKGTYTSKESGGVYTGQWEGGVKQGKATYTFGSGDSFEGNYVNNQRHGPGKLTKIDGEIREENWKEDKLVNFNTIKEGKKK